MSASFLLLLMRLCITCREVVIFCAVFLLSCETKPERSLPMDLPKESKQVVLVTTPSWDSTTGALTLFSKITGDWRKVSEEIPVTIGKNGLGWGLGVHVENKNGPQKREGDGKAPAGVFRLGTAFGYSPEIPSGISFPYRPVADRDYYVDDPTSKDYNRWVTLPPGSENTPERHWKSFERMQRDDHLYEYGIVVQHNATPIEPGKGSAIFFHVWRAPGVPTVGCTAMDKGKLLHVLRWLDPALNPLLIQIPIDELDNLNIAKDFPSGR